MAESGKPSRLTAAEAAIVILYVITMYRREKGKEVNRLRFSKATMRKLCVRKNLHDTFAAEVMSEIDEWGWTMFPVEDDFALIQTPTVKSWVRLGSKRIAPELKRLRRGEAGVIKMMLSDIEYDDTDDENEE